MPIHEKVLYNLSILEYIKNDYEKAEILLNQLKINYPRGRYGKKAEDAKQELIKIQEREKQEKSFEN